MENTKNLFFYYLFLISHFYINFFIAQIDYFKNLIDKKGPDKNL